MKKINLNRSEALRKPQPLNVPPEGPRLDHRVAVLAGKRAL
jgi:hypothetical protein